MNLSEIVVTIYKLIIKVLYVFTHNNIHAFSFFNGLIQVFISFVFWMKAFICLLRKQKRLLAFRIIRGQKIVCFTNHNVSIIQRTDPLFSLPYQLQSYYLKIISYYLIKHYLIFGSHLLTICDIVQRDNKP